jgi:regulator of sigma E protease
MFIVIAILVLGLLIVVHEFGHFLVAKRLGVGVLKFSVGFGPKLLGRKINETEYVLSAIPLGGYVKMVGEDSDEDAPDVDPRVSFARQAVWKRVAIVAAGPAANILFAFVVLSAVFYAYGLQVPSESSRIGAVSEDMPAAAAGIRSGDVVLSVGDRPVSTWKDLSDAIRTSQGREIVLRIQRGEESLNVPIRAVEKPEKNIFGEAKGSAYFIGIAPSIDRAYVGPLRAIATGAEYTVSLVRTIFTGVVKLIQGKINRADIGGPILIVQAAGQQAQVGLENLLHFMAVISINLGVLNLLPIPILDGGHVLFFLIEVVLRRPVDIRHREIAQQVGLVILVALMAFAFYNDILRVLQGGG